MVLHFQIEQIQPKSRRLKREIVFARALGIRWAMIKRFVSQHCGPDLHRDEWMNEILKNMWITSINNPVEHNWVPRAVDWPYSTFHRYVRKGVYSKDWGGGDIVKADSNFGE